MRSRGDRSAVLLVVGAALVFAGAWALLGLTGWFGLEWVRAIFSALGRIGWPLTLIIVGGLLIWAASSRGQFEERTRGKTWRRSRDDRMLAGVIGGLAEYLGMNATALRIIYVVLTIATNFFLGVVAYLIAVVAVPEAPPAGDVAPPAPPIPPSPPSQPPAPPAAPQG